MIISLFLLSDMSRTTVRKNLRDTGTVGLYTNFKTILTSSVRNFTKLSFSGLYTGLADKKNNPSTNNRLQKIFFPIIKIITSGPNFQGLP